MKRIFGNIIYGIGGGLEWIFSKIINVLEWIVEGIRLIGRGLLGLLFGIGCVVIFISPLVLAFIFNPAVFPIIMVFVLVSLLGQPLISYLRYGNYVITEFLKDYGEYLKNEGKKEYKSFRDFSNQYQRMQYEKKREEQRKYEEAQREENRRRQEAWEEAFRAWFNQTTGAYYQGQKDYRQSYERSSGYVNPNASFRQQYEEACNILGVNYNADKYQIKLAYRKLAKSYHPDINKDVNATEKFQKINTAYAFLNDENIKRYQGQ